MLLFKPSAARTAATVCVMTLCLLTTTHFHDVIHVLLLHRPVHLTTTYSVHRALRTYVLRRCHSFICTIDRLKLLELSGDAEPEPQELEAADVLVSTPEKFDALTRRLNEEGSGGSFFGDIALVLIDEVHLLAEAERGAALEAGVVSRIRMVSRFGSMRDMPIAQVRRSVYACDETMRGRERITSDA